MKILLVDDDNKKIENICKLFEEIELTEDDYMIASSSFDAKRILKDEHFDVLILDLYLPTRIGREPCQDSGINLLNEIFERDIYKKPDFIIGLTGLEDVYNRFNDDFKKRLLHLLKYDPLIEDWSITLKAALCEIKIGSGRQKRSDVRYKTDFCIVMALEDLELQSVLALNIHNSTLKEGVDSVLYYEGEIVIDEKHYSVIISCIGKMGSVQSAIHTYKIISQFRPRCIVMNGICAGVEKDVSLGDAIVATSIWDWQVGKYLPNNERANEVDQINMEKRIEMALKIQLGKEERLRQIHESWPASKPRNHPKVFFGPVVSGSAVVADGSIIEMIKRSQNRKLVGLEMEIFGVYSASRETTDCPPIYIALKGVSDKADEDKNDSIRHYASYVSAQLCLDAMFALIERNIIQK